MAIYPEHLEKGKLLTKENYQLFALFFVSAAIIYFTPQAIQRIYFIGFLILFYRSKSNYFWIAMVFLMMVAPAGFFSGSLSTDTQRVPLYSLGKGLSFSFFDLFFVSAFVKAMLSGPSIGYYFRPMLRTFIFFLILLMIYSMFLGMTFPSIILISRTTILPILFFIIAPRLITNSEDFQKMMRLLLPFIFLSFVGQFYSISFGKYLISIVKTSGSTVVSTGAALAEGSDETSRVFDASFLNTLSIIFCSFFIIRGERINASYLISIILLNFVICFTSATRGVFLTYVVILMALSWYIIKSSIYRGKYIKYLLLGLVIIIIGRVAIQTSETLSKQVQRSEQRISSLSILAGGDVSIEGSNLRTEVRIPKIMKKIKENPIVGWGFSDEGLEYQDGHIGMFNMVREGGFIEIFLFIGLFAQIARRANKLANTHGASISEKNSIRFLVVAFLSLIIDHSTSTQFFGFFIGFEATSKWMMVTFILLGLNVYYNQTKFNINYRLNKFYENNHSLRRDGNPAS